MGDIYGHKETEHEAEKVQRVGIAATESSAGLRTSEEGLAGEEGHLCRTWRLVHARRDNVLFCRGNRVDLLGRSLGCDRNLRRNLFRSLYLCLYLFLFRSRGNEAGPVCKADGYLVEVTWKSDENAPMGPDVC